MASSKVFAALAALFSLFTLFSQHVSAAPAQEKEWTMLVYINGHNNLDYYGKLDINEMEQVGSTDQTNVVVQWASLAAPTTKRLLVQKDTDKFKVTSPVVQDLPRVDMGDYKNLVEFVRWGAANYPARHYFVVIWNHGTGWHSLMHQRADFRDISVDDISKNRITTVQLGLAMEQISKVIGRKVDIYGSDACLMGMVEVAHQMKDSVQYFVGSEETEPGDGWPYNTLLEKWNQLPSATPEEVAKLVPAVYTASYKQPVTMAAYDLSNIDALATSISNLRAMLTSTTSISKADLAAAVKTSIKFSLPDYVDLGSFLANLQARNPAAEQYIDSVNAEMKKFVISNEVSGSFKQAQGLAIWLPSAQFDYTKWQKKYSELTFDVVTQWHQVIESSL